MLREPRPDLRIGFFLHIPFPPTELFVQLPWRRQILEGLLGADLVGFQRAGGAENFVRLVRQRVGHTTQRDVVYLPDGRTVQAAAFPISIDYEGLAELSQTDGRGGPRQRDPRAAGQPRAGAARRRPARLHQGHLHAAQGVRRAARGGRAQRRGRGDVQVATPSRERVDEYRRLRDEIDRLVGRINGDYGRIGRPAIYYLHSSYPQRRDGGDVPRRRRHGGHAAARRHEPGRQGVRRLPPGRRRRAGALGVRRRRRRAQAGVPGEPLRHRRHEGRDPPGLPQPAPGAVPPDAGDAHDGPRARRRRLGRAVHDRRCAARSGSTSERLRRPRGRRG